MNFRRRFNKLTPSLTPVERARLALRALKEDAPEDRAWRQNLPPSQADELARLLGLITVSNVQIAISLEMLRMQAQSLQMRDAWLSSLLLWQEHVDQIRFAVRMAVPDLLTEKEFKATVDEERSEWVCVEELAEIWAEEVFGPTCSGEADDSPGAWGRLAKEKERELRALARNKRLPARGKGAGLQIRYGEFEDFLGLSSTVCVDARLPYLVLPDAQADHVERCRESIKRLQTVLDCTSSASTDQPEEGAVPERLIRGLEDSLRGDVLYLWVQARMIELALDEIGEEFGGEDPLRHDARHALLEVKDMVTGVHDHLCSIGVASELREPTEDEMFEMRRLLERDL